MNALRGRQGLPPLQCRPPKPIIPSPEGRKETRVEREKRELWNAMARKEREHPTWRRPAPDYRGTINLAEAARFLECTPTMLSMLLRNNHIPHETIDGQVRFHRQDLLNWTASNPNWRRTL